MPDIQSPLCSCGLALKTSCHIVIDCPLTATVRERLDISLIPQVIRSYHDFTATLKNTDRAQIIARWFLKLNRLKEFRLAIKIGEISKK
jgi:hypothetical protein